jgi:hypothetical protein
MPKRGETWTDAQRAKMAVSWTDERRAANAERFRAARVTSDFRAKRAAAQLGEANPAWRGEDATCNKLDPID